MKTKLYYSIRVVEATSEKQAIKKVQDSDFQELDEICDKVLSKKELEKELKKRTK